MNKSEAGRLGGMTTFSRYGATHMSEIGKLGASAFWSKYKLIPLGTYNFSIVSRATGEFISSIYIQKRIGDNR